MLTLHRSAVRHPMFSETRGNALAEIYPKGRIQIIDGAVWEIQRSPKAIGMYIKELDVWQARLSAPPVLVYYSFNRRFVTMLTMQCWDGSFSL